MIVGLGNDIVNIKRIEKIYNCYNVALAHKILHPQEIIQYNDLPLEQQKISFLAKRFAAKEAFVKAIGTGFNHEFTLMNICVTNNHLGKPNIECSNLAVNLIVHLTISDDYPFAFATVIIEKM